MTLPDFLRSDEYGEIFLAGHRVTLHHIIKDYQDGYTAETLATAYPTLPLALLHKVIAFYLENQVEVEQYVKETRAEVERQAAAPQPGPSLAELQHRLEARRQAESAETVDIRFLLDEQLRGQLWHAIRWHNQRGAYPLDVVRVGDHADLPQGATDPEVLAWAEREGRMLVSGDRRTLLNHLADHLKDGRHIPGLFLLRPLAPLPQIVEFLVAAAYASEASEWADNWRYIP